MDAEKRFMNAWKRYLKISNVFIVLALTCVWILLLESFSVATIVSGLIISAATLFFCKHALPMDKISNVRFYKLAMYPLFLIGQVYMAGFHVIKLIFTGAKAEIIQVKTEIDSESLRIILVDSVTLTPGSVLIKLDGNEFTLLWLRGKGDDALSDEERDYAIKGRLEEWLIRAQK